MTNLAVLFILHIKQGHIFCGISIRKEFSRVPSANHTWTPQCISTPLLGDFSGLVTGPTLCGWAWLGLSQRRPQLGWPGGFCWFSLRSLEQEKRKEACCGHHSHVLLGWEGRIYKDLFIIEVKLTCRAQFLSAQHRCTHECDHSDWDRTSAVERAAPCPLPASSPSKYNHYSDVDDQRFKFSWAKRGAGFDIRFTRKLRS